MLELGACKVMSDIEEPGLRIGVRLTTDTSSDEVVTVWQTKTNAYTVCNFLKL